MDIAKYHGEKQEVIRNAALFVYQVRAWTSLKGRQPMRARGGMGAWLQASFDWLLLKRGEHTCYMQLASFCSVSKPPARLLTALKGGKSDLHNSTSSFITNA